MLATAVSLNILVMLWTFLFVVLIPVHRPFPLWARLGVGLGQVTMFAAYLALWGAVGGCATVQVCETLDCERDRCHELATMVANRMLPDGARRLTLLGKMSEFTSGMEAYLHQQDITCEDALAREMGREPMSRPVEPERRLQRLERE